MAAASELIQVRLNTSTDNTAPYDDSYVNGLIDALGVDGASAIIWRSLAAKYSSKVNVSEAGASHAFGDLFKNAMLMAAKFESGPDEVLNSGRPRVSAIVRST